MRASCVWGLCLGLSLLPNGLCWSAAKAEDGTGGPRYTIEDLQGEAAVARKGAERTLKEGDVLSPGDEVRIGKDGQAVLMLDDETSVQLSPGSRVRVSVLESSPQGGFVSRLGLMGGRLLAEVKKLGEKDSRFEVESGGVVCGVRGTQFEVEVQGEDLETRTNEGEVEVLAGDRRETVRPGNVIAFRRGLMRMHRRMDRVELQRFAKWKERRSIIREKRLKRLKDLRHRAPKVERRVLRRRR